MPLVYIPQRTGPSYTSTWTPTDMMPWIGGNYPTATTTPATTYQVYRWIDAGTGTSTISWAGNLITNPMLIHHITMPAIITHQEEARRDEKLYRRALAECDEQEAARVLHLIQAREQAVAAQQAAIAEQQQRQREAQAAREVANARANELLLEHLTPQQRDSFTKNGWFVVEGGRSKTKYRINGRHIVANVDVLHGHDEMITHRLCAHPPSHSVPLGDHLLAQKMMLQYSEDDFLRVANRHG